MMIAMAGRSEQDCISHKRNLKGTKLPSFGRRVFSRNVLARGGQTVQQTSKQTGRSEGPPSTAQTILSSSLA